MSRSFPLLSYTMSNLSDGYEDVSVGLPQTMLAPESVLYWLKGALPSNLSCTFNHAGACEAGHIFCMCGMPSRMNTFIWDVGCGVSKRLEHRRVHA